ncbi:MAG: hydroxyacid dehydrogenase [Planctomycetota bacterium]|nr:hydroxyacid dehydrogenase [Planctomycetota bacterium]
MPPDVFFYEAFAEEADAIRRLVPPHVRAELTWQTPQEAGHTAPPARVVSIRTQSCIPPAWAGQIDAVLARTTGYDHMLSLRRAFAHTARPVALGHLPLYCARAVAEQAMLLWTALLRRLPLQMRQFAAFARDGLTGAECKGRRLLVVGVGNIGSQIVRIAEGLEMTALGVDVVRRHEGVRYVAIDEGLAQADVVVCAMNLTPANAGYFDYARLSACRPGAVFVNVARGELSPAADLLHLLEEGRLGGVGLDVFQEEAALAVALRQGDASPGANSPAIAATLALAARPDVIVTPHNAFNTRESLARKAAQSVESILHFLKAGVFPNPVPSE